MASAGEGLPTRLMFPSLAADDFVVISDASTGSVPNTPSPDEPQASKFSLSLLEHTGSESDIQKLAKQIDRVRDRNSNLHRRLSGNSASMDQIHGALHGRLNEMQKAIQLAETALMLKTEQYQKLQSGNEKLREDYNCLSQRQEEWNQTYKDYNKLKNDYNLLSNTKERLELERADLQRNRVEALAAETAKVKAEFDERLKSGIEAERSKCSEEVAAAQKEREDKLVAAKLDFDHCKAELLSNHKEAMEAMRGQLELQVQKLQADLESSKSASQAALDSEREERRAELDQLVSEHQKAMSSLTTDYQAEIAKQITLVEATRLELVDCTSKHEEEKRELFDQLRQLNLGASFQHVPSCSDAQTNMPSIASVCHADLASFQHVPDTEIRVYSDTNYLNNALDRPAVQEQASSTNSQQMADAATHMSAIALSQASKTRTPVFQGAGTLSVQLATKEVQTDEVQQELQAANAESLQREGTVKHLQMQLASFAQSLRTEREAKGKLELENKQLQKECDHLRSQSSAGSDQACQSTTLQQSVCDIRAQLQKKQSELDSVLEDLDETRHKLYEHMENEKRQLCQLTANNTQIEKLRRTIRESESQAEIERSQLRMELESSRHGDQFKDTKLTAAQNEAENLRQEIHRLKQSEDELNKRCRDNNQTVQQIIESAEQEKQRFNEQIEELKSRSEVQLEVIESNKQALEQKADLEMRLKEEISIMAGKLRCQAEENNQCLIVANRKVDSMYNKMCEYSEQLENAKRQLEHTEQQHGLSNERLNQSEQQLAETRDRLDFGEQQLRQFEFKLQDSEKFASEMQAYSSNLETELESTKRQLLDSSKKRDDLIGMAEQLRSVYENELQKTAVLESELSKLKDELTAVRADYSNVEQNVAQILAREHDAKVQLTQAKNSLRQAEEAIERLRRHAREEVEKFNAERSELNDRINKLIDEITSANAPGSNSSNNLLNRHRNSIRRGQGGGNV